MPIDVPQHPPTPPAALDAALAFLEGSLCPDGSDEGGCADGERTGREWRLLYEWCRDKDLLVSASVTPERVGGREHDVTFLETERRWLKFTKWNQAGFTVDFETGQPLFLPASPREYLVRLRLQNERFGDAWNLVGMQLKEHSLRIVTSQPDIVGEAPTPEELDRHMRQDFGCRRLEIPPMGYHKSQSYLAQGVGIFDVHPANAVVSTSGLLLPIDFVLVSLDATAQSLMEARVAEGTGS